MQTTPNLKLKKPDLIDYVSVEDLNENMDKIDNAVQSEKEMVATHLADETAHGIGDKAILKTTDKSSIVGAMNELFTNASNGKTDIAYVTGAPATVNDTFAQLKTHIQNAKNKGAANLVAKGLTASGTETLELLMTKIANVQTGIKSAGGKVPTTAPTSGANAVQASGLGFKPKLIVAWAANGSNFDFVVYNEPINAGLSYRALFNFTSSQQVQRDNFYENFYYVRDGSFSLNMNRAIPEGVNWRAFE